MLPTKDIIGSLKIQKSVLMLYKWLEVLLNVFCTVWYWNQGSQAERIRLREFCILKGTKAEKDWSSYSICSNYVLDSSSLFAARMNTSGELWSRDIFLLYRKTVLVKFRRSRGSTPSAAGTNPMWTLHTCLCTRTFKKKMLLSCCCSFWLCKNLWARLG